MNNQSDLLADRIRALTSQPAHSTHALVLQHMPDIILARQKGVKWADLSVTFTSQGASITPQVLRSYASRWRQSGQKSSPKNATKSQDAIPSKRLQAANEVIHDALHQRGECNGLNDRLLEMTNRWSATTLKPLNYNVSGLKPAKMD